MRNDDDLRAQQIISAARTTTANRFLAGSVGGARSSNPATNSLVTETGTISRLWLTGDPWEAGYHFGQSKFKESSLEESI